jgi:hypothetical protein
MYLIENKANIFVSGSEEERGRPRAEPVASGAFKSLCDDHNRKRLEHSDKKKARREKIASPELRFNQVK